MLADDACCARPALKQDEPVVKNRRLDQASNQMRFIEDRSTSEDDIFRGTNQ